MLAENQYVTASAESNYLPKQSDPKKNRYVFSYTITISNNSSKACQLLSRHWVIQDANHKVEEVYGEGVIGEQPIIKPGEMYSYTSGAILETEMGTMEGRYFMVRTLRTNDQKPQVEEFEILVPKFLLCIPRILH